MATQIGQYTVLRKARVNPVDGTVTIVLTVVDGNGGRVAVDNIPTNLSAALLTNLQAVAGQYDYIGA